MIQSWTLESSITHPTHPTTFYIQNLASSDKKKSESIFAGTNWLLTHQKLAKWTQFLLSIWMFPKMVVPPKSSILTGFSIIFTIHFGVAFPLFLVQHPNLRISSLWKPTSPGPFSASFSEAPGSWVLSFCLLKRRSGGRKFGSCLNTGKPSGLWRLRGFTFIQMNRLFYPLLQGVGKHWYIISCKSIPWWSLTNLNDMQIFFGVALLYVLCIEWLSNFQIHCIC